MNGMAMHLFGDTPMPSGQGILNIHLTPEKIKIKPIIIKVDMAVVGIIMILKLQILTLVGKYAKVVKSKPLKSEVFIMKFIDDLVL